MNTIWVLIMFVVSLNGTIEQIPIKEYKSKAVCANSIGSCMTLSSTVSFLCVEKTVTDNQAGTLGG